MQKAYQEAYAFYENQLNGQRPRSVIITLGVPETLPLDEDLWERLFDIYCYHGWDGVRHVEEIVHRLAPRAPVPGPRESPWTAAWRFFRFTQTLLAARVKDALVEIEHAAATRMADQLGRSLEAVSAAKTGHFQITKTDEVYAVGIMTRVGPIPSIVTRYHFGAKKASDSLFTSLTKAVEQRTTYENTLQRVAAVRDHIRYLKKLSERAHAHGVPLSSEKELTTELSGKSKEMDELEKQATDFYKSMLKVINTDSPMGLLVLESLDAGFTQDLMEERLGALLWELEERVTALRKAVKPEQRLAATAFQAVELPAAGPEGFIIGRAMDAVADEPAWFPLLHEQTLHQLIESGTIARDSFTFVVLIQYVLALAARLDAERQADQRSREFWQGLSKAAAAASLALLVTPAFKLSVVARGVVAAADLVLLAHTITSVTGQLARLDYLQNYQVVGADAFSVEGLGRIGELGVYRNQLAQEIPQQILIELVLIAAGAQWTLVKRGLIFRGYVQDLQTLLAVDDEAEKD
jgi:hypothetical protein